MGMTVLRCENVSVSLGARRVLNDISFTLAKGEVCGVVGPNGAGKSTLLRAVTGLLLFTGAIQIEDRSLDDWKKPELARARAYLPQDGAIAWGLTVREVAALGRHPHVRYGADPNAQAVDRALEMALLSEFADRPVSSLSGGERARCLLARALAGEARLIVADEPAAQLDPQHHWRAMHLLRHAANNGAAIILALHDLTVAVRQCDRILLLSEGSIAGYGSPQEVLTANRLRTVFGVEALIAAHGGEPYIVPLRPSIIASAGQSSG
jgi:iron complex transport system ATP-binding protein